MNHLESMFEGVTFTNNDQVFKILKDEGMDNLDTLCEAREDDLRKAGLKMGDIIKIRKIIASHKINGLESSFSSTSEAEEPISNSMEGNNTSTAPGRNELNPQISRQVNNGSELSPGSTYKPAEMLQKCQKGGKPSKAQLYFRNLLRDCARQAKIWEKALPLPSIPDGKMRKFFELIDTAAPQLATHRSEVRVRLGHALQNKRKYINDINSGKRKNKNSRNPENGASASTKVQSSIEAWSPLCQSERRNIETNEAVDELNGTLASLSSGEEPKVAFNHGEEVIVYRTTAKKTKLAKAAYLGPKDDHDANDMFSTLQLRTKYVKSDDEVSLPESNSDGKSTLNELELNDMFTWKTQKISKIKDTAVCRSTKTSSKKKPLKESESVPATGGKKKAVSKVADAPPKKKFKRMIEQLENERMQDEKADTDREEDDCSIIVKGLDGGNINVGCWVAVAYDKTYYVGRILSIESEEEVKVDFLAKKRDGLYKWPNIKDTSIVNKLYVFCSAPRVQKVGNEFVVNNPNGLDHMYKAYQNKYMT